MSASGRTSCDAIDRIGNPRDVFDWLTPGVSLVKCSAFLAHGNALVVYRETRGSSDSIQDMNELRLATVTVCT